MNGLIALNIIVEDVLSEAVLKKLIPVANVGLCAGITYGLQGNDYIRRTISGFNHAAKGTPYLVLTDLDAGECAPSLMRGWLPSLLHSNLLFRVAVREVESWLLADRAALAAYLKIAESRIPVDPDAIPEPKEFLINLARGSRVKDLRDDIVPRSGTTGRQGAGYNGALVAFIMSAWSPERAQAHSPSLAGAIAAIRGFRPSIEPPT